MNPMIDMLASGGASALSRADALGLGIGGGIGASRNLPQATGGPDGLLGLLDALNWGRRQVVRGAGGIGDAIGLTPGGADSGEGAELIRHLFRQADPESTGVRDIPAIPETYDPNNGRVSRRGSPGRLEDIQGQDSPWVKLLGLGVDVGLDPLNWMTGGLGAVAGARRMSRGLEAAKAAKMAAAIEPEAATAAQLMRSAGPARQVNLLDEGSMLAKRGALKGEGTMPVRSPQRIADVPSSRFPSSVPMEIPGERQSLSTSDLFAPDRLRELSAAAPDEFEKLLALLENAKVRGTGSPTMMMPRSNPFLEALGGRDENLAQLPAQLSLGRDKIIRRNG